MDLVDPRERESILRDVVDPDDEVRRLAVERMAILPVEEVLPHYVDRLGDNSWRVRKAAIERLAATGHPSLTTAFLVRALADGENPGRRNAALEALVRCGTSAVPALLEAAGAQDVDVRKQIVDALAGIGDRSACPRLIAMLSDPDANVRGAVADALGAIGDPETAADLLAVVGAEEERLVVLSALRALARMEQPVPVAQLEALLGDSLLQPAVMSLLGYSHDDAAKETLLKGLASGSRSGREAAMESLLRQAGGGEDVLLVTRVREVCAAAPDVLAGALERLETAPLSARLMLVQFLGLLGDLASVLPLLRAGQDEALTEIVLSTAVGFGEGAAAALAEGFHGLGADERVMACQILGRLPGDVGSEQLIECLGHSDPELRGAAIRGLAARSCTAGLAPLVAHLAWAAARGDEAGEDEAGLVADAIADIAGPVEGGADAEAEVVSRQAVLLLGGRLPDAGEAFRRAAARALGRIGRARDVDAMTLLMSDPDAAVRRAAVEALARLQGSELPELLHLAIADESATVRVALAGALAASLDPRALDDLERLAADEDIHVRAAVMRALGAMRTVGSAEPSGRERRIAVLRCGAVDQSLVAVAALEALLAIGGPSSAEVALALLESPEEELVRVAIACVGSHGDLEAQKELFPLVAHSEWSVRAEAVRVLGDSRVVMAVPTLLRGLETEQDEFVREALLRALGVLEH